MKHIASKKYRYHQAFTMIELSIFIAIISIILAAMLPIKNAQLYSNKVQTSYDRIETIYQALGRYLLIHGKLPCPAPITAIKFSDSLYGTASVADGNCAYSTDSSANGIYQSTSTGATNLVYGMVPVATLGLSEDFAEDGFGSKFDYIIDKNFTHVDTFGTAYTSNSSALTNSISTNFSVINYVDITQENAIDGKAIFAIISHGANKSGAFGANSASITQAPTDASEIQNSATSHNDAPETNTAIFSNKKVILDPANTATLLLRMFYPTIDDIVFAKTRDDLVRDFNAYSLIPCQADGYNSTLVYDTTTMIWPDKTKYNSDAISITECPTGYQEGAAYPAKRCGPFGIWQSSVVIPCETS